MQHCLLKPIQKLRKITVFLLPSLKMKNGEECKVYKMYQFTHELKIYAGDWFIYLPYSECIDGKL